jgi:hypothetical protein
LKGLGGKTACGKKGGWPLVCAFCFDVFSVVLGFVEPECWV